MEYSITKKQCQEQIKSNGNKVCSRCGRNVVPIETVDNARTPTYWAGCMHNNILGDRGHFDNGATKEIYKLAYKLVLEDDLYFYSDKDTEDFDYWFTSSVSKVCGMLRTIEYLKSNKPRFTKTELRKRFK